MTRGSADEQPTAAATPRHFRADDAGGEYPELTPVEASGAAAADAPATGEHPSGSDHHTHHTHRSHRSHRSKHSHHSHADLIALWDIERGDETSAGTGTKVISPDPAQTGPELVVPDKNESGIPTQQMAVAQGENRTEYVIPPQRDRHGVEKSLHSGKTKAATPEEIAAAEEGFVFRTPHKKKKKHRRVPLWLKIILIVLAVLLVIAAALVSTFFILKDIGRRSLHNYDNIEIVSPTTADTKEEVIEVIDSGRSVVYNGREYRFNEDVVCIAVIGINRDVDEWGNAGQPMADSINMVGFDTVSGKLSVIAVSRDTMTNVSVYSVEGRHIDNETMQLSYAYSFDGNGVSGGANTTSSLSKLFYGLPVNNYFSLNLDALSALTDAIGGVKLTSSMDFSTPYRDITAGETVTLSGEEAERYVQTRSQDAQGNVGRMQRQQEYIRAFLSQVIPAVKNDLSVVTKLYGIIEDNSESNLDLAKIVYLASELVSQQDAVSNISYRTIQGEAKEGEEHAEFYADDANVLETMLDVFYTPKES